MSYDLFLWDARVHGADGARLYAAAAEDELAVGRASKELSDLQRAVQAQFGGRLSVPLEEAAAEHGAFIVSVPFALADELVAFVGRRLGRHLALYDPQLDDSDEGPDAEITIDGTDGAAIADGEADERFLRGDERLPHEERGPFSHLLVPRTPFQALDEVLAALRGGRFHDLAQGARPAEMQDAMERLPLLRRYLVRPRALRGRAVVLAFPLDEYLDAMAADDFDVLIEWLFDPHLQHWEGYGIVVADDPTDGALP